MSFSLVMNNGVYQFGMQSNSSSNRMRLTSLCSTSTGAQRVPAREDPHDVETVRFESGQVVDVADVGVLHARRIDPTALGEAVDQLGLERSAVTPVGLPFQVGRSGDALTGERHQRRIVDRQDGADRHDRDAAGPCGQHALGHADAELGRARTYGLLGTVGRRFDDVQVDACVPIPAELLRGVDTDVVRVRRPVQHQRRVA